MVIVGAAYFVLTYSPSSVDKLFGFLGQVPVVKYLPAVQDRQATEFIIIDDQSESFDLKINSPERARELASQLELPAGKTQVRLVLLDEELPHNFKVIAPDGNELNYLSLGQPNSPLTDQPHQLEIHININRQAADEMGWSNERLLEFVEPDFYQEVFLANSMQIAETQPSANLDQQQASYQNRAITLYRYLNNLNESSLFAISW